MGRIAVTAEGRPRTRPADAVRFVGWNACKL